MAGSVYPGALDDFAESSPTYMSDPDATGRTHEGRHNDVEAAIEQVEETLGVNPQGGNATVAARIANIIAVGTQTHFVAGPGEQWPIQIQVQNADHPTSQRAVVKFGHIVGFIYDVGVDIHGSGAQSFWLWNAANNQAPLATDSADALFNRGRQIPTHYWDESVGRRLFVWDTNNARWQMVYGDTGWRDIASLLTPGYNTPAAVGYLRLRRVNSTVHIAGLIQATDASNPTVFVSPAGFMPYTNVPIPITNNTANLWAQNFNVWGMGLGSDVYFAAGASTSEAWPTVLPGVASGGIPTAENLLPSDTSPDIDPAIPTGLTADDDTSGWTVEYPEGPVAP